MSGSAAASVLDSTVSGADPGRILAIAGLLLVAGGMLFGEVFAIFVLHPNNARIGEAMLAASQLIGSGDVDGILSQFTIIGGLLENRGTKVDAHSHMIHMGYIALLLALLQPWVALDSQLKRRGAWLFVIPALLLPPSIFSIHYLGLAYSPLSHIGWGSILADLSGALLAVAMLIQFWGLWRQARGHGVQQSPHLPSSAQRASRLLLVGGLLLLVCGFLYGAAYAAWRQGDSAVAELDILQSILVHAAAGEQTLLAADFSAFGKFQMYRAINVATHTHINELALLLLLLSCLQGLLHNAECWRWRWACLAVTSAWLLPLGILLEIPFGVVGSIIADLSGFGMIISLLAMMFAFLARGRVNNARGSAG